MTLAFWPKKQYFFDELFFGSFGSWRLDSGKWCGYEVDESYVIIFLYYISYVQKKVKKTTKILRLILIFKNLSPPSILEILTRNFFCQFFISYYIWNRHGFLKYDLILILEILKIWREIISKKLCDILSVTVCNHNLFHSHLHKKSSDLLKWAHVCLPHVCTYPCKKDIKCMDKTT